jgi:hypothetical protein
MLPVSLISDSEEEQPVLAQDGVSILTDSVQPPTTLSLV